MPESSAAGLTASPVRLPWGRDEEHADQRQHNREYLKHAGAALLLDADDQQDDDGGDVLQNRAHACAGQLDRQKVGELAAADARQTVDQQVNGVARIFPDVPRVKKRFAVLYKKESAQDQPRQKQPDGHEPGRIHPLAGEQVLPHAARNAPARRAAHRQGGAFYAVRHCVAPLL